MNLKSVRSVRNFNGSRVIVRVDFNVPFDSHGRILDDFRVRHTLPTLKWILGHNGRVFIITHLGQPKGRDMRFSIRPVARHLAKLLKRDVRVVKDPIKQTPGSFKEAVIICENIRFWPGESQNKLQFAKALARWGTMYVNDAFAESHRAVASIVGLPKLIPAYVGLLFEHEIYELQKIFKNPKRPFLIIVGGAKISTKIGYLNKLIKRADRLILGGALFNTVMASKGLETGESLIERPSFTKARKLVRSRKVILPVDVCTIRGFHADSHPAVHAVNEVAKKDYISDIGPRSVRVFGAEIAKARTILWNGPLGYMEVPHCRKGTVKVAKFLKKSRAKIVIGGGDLVALFETERISAGNKYFSTGGGALLQFAAEGTLPGIKALQTK